VSVFVALAVIAGGGVAAVARYLVAVAFAGNRRFPWAVLVVNVIGAALGGAVLGLGATLDADIRLMLLTGVAGGLTTFSTLSAETVQLVLDGRWRTAAGSVGANVALGLAAVAAGWALVAAV
jgi:CrcB protein